MPSGTVSSTAQVGQYFENNGDPFTQAVIGMFGGSAAFPQMLELTCDNPQYDILSRNSSQAAAGEVLQQRSPGVQTQQPGEASSGSSNVDFGNKGNDDDG